MIGHARKKVLENAKTMRAVEADQIKAGHL